MHNKTLFFTWFLTFLASVAFAQGQSGTITYDIHLNTLKNSHQARLWLPYPLASTTQTIDKIKVEGNYDTSGVYRDPQTGATYLYAQWNRITTPPAVVMTFHVNSHGHKQTGLHAADLPIPAPIKEYLKSTPCAPITPQIRRIARQATKGKKTILAKARAVYDWVVDNTFRDPSVHGCGLGIPSRTLNELEGGGKCADLSSVFVSIARAAGVPARDVFGLRLAHPKADDITSAFHCWAQFYLPGTGWVTADPADVRKMMLVHHLKQAGKWREFFWGGDDLFRVALEKHARCVTFVPRQKGKPLGYFMYPFAQVDGQTLNYFAPQKFRYSVHFTPDNSKS